MDKFLDEVVGRLQEFLNYPNNSQTGIGITTKWGLQGACLTLTSEYRKIRIPSPINAQPINAKTKKAVG